MHEYDLIADWYASERVDQTGVPEVGALAESLTHDSLVLDIGCGNGYPITRTLLRAGHRVVGLDSSVRMLERFRINLPSIPAVRGSVQSCPFRNLSFDAAVAWGVIFHLTPPDEIAAIANVARLLKPGAPFLFTAGDDDGHRDDFTGTMNDVTFHYYSFTAAEYGRVLADHGLTLVDTHADAGKNFYYLAHKV